MISMSHPGRRPNMSRARCGVRYRYRSHSPAPSTSSSATAPAQHNRDVVDCLGFNSTGTNVFLLEDVSMLIGSVFRNLIWPAGLHRRASTPHHSAATLNNRTPRLVERP